MFSLLPQLREAAWLAAGQHGFAALAGLPELQQLLQHCCMGACDRTAGTVGLAPKSSDAEFVQRIDDRASLMEHLVPQLRVCLLADVAAGLLVPG
jgi:predicted protein tyrosine phosphatase